MCPSGPSSDLDPAAHALILPLEAEAFESINVGLGEPGLRGSAYRFGPFTALAAQGSLRGRGRCPKTACRGPAALGLSPQSAGIDLVIGHDFPMTSALALWTEDT